jgi:hypothetical protein
LPFPPLFERVIILEGKTMRYDNWRPKKYACGRTIILGGEDRQKSINYVLFRY